MKLRVLGCSGGIGGELRTTSLLLDHDTLIDAGTGVGDLSINELAQIDHVFVTHSHMDHVASIPFLVDTVVSKHLCPSLLAAELAKLKLSPEIYITHLKPRESELIMQQIAVTVKERRPQMLQHNHVFEF